MFRFSVKIDGDFYKTTWKQASDFISLMRMNMEDKHTFHSFVRRWSP